MGKRPISQNAAASTCGVSVDDGTSREDLSPVTTLRALRRRQTLRRLAIEGESITQSLLEGQTRDSLSSEARLSFKALRKRISAFQWILPDRHEELLSSMQATLMWACLEDFLHWRHRLRCPKMEQVVGPNGAVVDRPDYAQQRLAFAGYKSSLRLLMKLVGPPPSDTAA